MAELPALRYQKPTSLRLLVFGVITLVATVMPGPRLLLAQPQVRGTPEAVRIDARDSSIDDIMAALDQMFDLRYKSKVKLKEPISGTYEGTLRYVVVRLLKGHDFVLKSGGGRIEVTVLAPANVSTAVASQASPAGKLTVQKPATRHALKVAAVVQKPERKTPGLSPVPKKLSAEQKDLLPAPTPRASKIKAPEPTASKLAPIAVTGSMRVPKVRPSTIEPPLPQLLKKQ